MDWDEIKRRRNLNLTDTAWRLLEKAGKERGISRSEVIERLIRGLYLSDGSREDCVAR